MQRGGHKTKGRLSTHFPIFRAVRGCCCRSHAVAVDEGSDQTAVGIAGGSPRVAGFGYVNADGFFSIPVTFYLQAMFIETAATITMTEIVRVVILKSFFRHAISFFKIV